MSSIKSDGTMILMMFNAQDFIQHLCHFSMADHISMTSTFVRNMEVSSLSIIPLAQNPVRPRLVSPPGEQRGPKLQGLLQAWKIYYGGGRRHAPTP